MSKFVNFIKNSSSRQRRFILGIIDFILIIFSLFIVSESFVKYAENSSFFSFNFNILFLAICGIILYVLTGQYTSLTRYATSKTAYYLALRNFILVVFIFFFLKVIGIEVIYSNNIVILWLLLICTTGGVRFVLRDFLYLLNKSNLKVSSSNAIIYGAGEAGVELFVSLKNNYKNVVCFIDDNKDLWGRYISGIPIKSPKSLEKFQNISETIYLAMPSITKSQYKAIFSKISKLGYKILKVPTLYEIASRKLSVDSFSTLQIEDILGRDEAIPNEDLLKSSIEGKNILISGAGGTIGCELCKQIVKRKPNHLTLLDISEPSLYKISEELKKYSSEFGNIEFSLGSACNNKLVNNLIERNKVNIIFHAAAYKHVPLVEINPISGILNNVLTTKNLCSLSLKNNIEKFVLISSDKAVRPTSIMGASKRVCELIVQSHRELAIEENKSIIFSTVRFGNVLRSSGSVVPSFEEQINKGGPVIVTHPDVNRYFMTIEEAASLVIQASALSKGGEIFLLDMGSPIKIVDLARKMINLRGFSVKDDENTTGYIQIKFCGLRKGEKLFEELLIEDNAEKTDHPLIFKAQEEIRNNLILIKKIEELIQNLIDFKEEEVFKVLKEVVPEWKTSSRI